MLGIFFYAPVFFWGCNLNLPPTPLSCSFGVPPPPLTGLHCVLVHDILAMVPPSLHPDIQTDTGQIPY